MNGIGTYSIIGRCERSGMFGLAIATSEMAVGSRCIHVAPGAGAVISQASSNPRLGHLGLALLRQGFAAPQVVEQLATGDEFPERRQLGCVDTTGQPAARTGSANRAWAGHRTARNVVVAGNMVVGPAVVEAMFLAFTTSPDRPLWERLLGALEAGKRAGGEPKGETSSALHVVDRQPYALVDLRVDFHAEPIAELRRLADRYFPLIEYYQRRPLDPSMPPAAEWLAAQARASQDRA
jgi:uncharacterized Ntn-hydrolase superfamily protein